ncbi:unnamed protein product, partial [marine sediment metagenome]
MSKSLLELKDSKGLIAEENQAIFDLSDVEKRSMTDEEKTTVADNLLKMDRLDLEIR